MTGRERLLALLSPELVTALEALVDERLARVSAGGDASTWPEWMNVETAAGYLDCAPERVRKLQARHAIPFHQESRGCRVFFRRTELDSWMAGYSRERRGAAPE